MSNESPLHPNKGVMMRSRIVSLIAVGALAAGGMLVAPAVGDAPAASANAFTCVIFKNYSGGYSLADGCRASRYWEKANGSWIDAGWRSRGTKSEFMKCFYRYQKSDYDQYI